MKYRYWLTVAAAVASLGAVIASATDGRWLSVCLFAGTAIFWSATAARQRRAIRENAAA